MARGKRRHRRRQRGDAGPLKATPNAPSVTTPVARVEPRLPTPTARATGLIVALVTAFLAVLMVRDGLTGDHAAAEATARIAIGAVLVAVALFVGALCVAPWWVRGLLVRR